MKHVQSLETRKDLKKSILVIASTVFIFILTGLIGFGAISRQIVDNTLTYMTELAVHDECSINNSLKLFQTRLEGAAQYLAERPNQTIESISSILSNIQAPLDIEDICLISGSGLILNSQGELKNDLADPLVQYALKSGDSFYASNQDLGLSQKEPYVYIGHSVENLTVDGSKFSYIIGKAPITMIEDLLNIPSYDNLGYAGIISPDGSYIASSKRSFNDYKDQNFLDFQRTFRIQYGPDINGILQKIHDRECFYVQSENNGHSYATAFVPMQTGNWYYIVAVPYSYFGEQIQRLTTICGVMIFIMVLALSGAFGAIYRTNRQKQLADEKYKKELKDALNLAEQSNRAKTVFLNNMSHDIRTPMNAVLGYTVLAQSHTDDPAAIKEYLRKITQSFDHLLSLINDVLDMSRIESGKVSIESQPENLGAILNTIQDIMIKEVQAKNQNLHIDISRLSHPFVYCDKLRINQVLINTLSNAVKFTPPGGDVYLTVAEKPSPKDGYGIFKITVRDTGIGMSPEFQKIIFEPFTRERTSTVSGIPGTGLGMSITRSIVDMMNGSIDLQSRQNEGTTLTIELELKLQDEEKDLQVLQKLFGSKALIVDQEEDEGRRIADLIDPLEIRSDWTDTVRNALGILTAARQTGYPYSIVILNDGGAAAEGIQKAMEIHSLDPNLQILLMTDAEWKDLEKEAVPAVIKGIIRKPATFETLRHALLITATGMEDSKESLSIRKAGILHASSAENYRLLVVEDNEFNREIAQEILEEAGFKVECVNDGHESVKVIQEKPAGYYDAVLMDLQMPVMDGYEAARRIRHLDDPGKASVTIIALTANAFKEDRDKVMKAGMNGFVSKPINIKELFETLSSLLNSKKRK